MGRQRCENGAACKTGNCGTICLRPSIIETAGVDKRCHGYVVDGFMQCSLCPNTWGLMEDQPICKYEPINASLRFRKGPADYMEDAAKLFRKRNAVYSDGYKRMGPLLLALFPESGIPPIRTPDEASRFAHLVMCVTKLHRYAHNFAEGGHPDSAEDLIVYAAFLLEATDVR